VNGRRGEGEKRRKGRKGEGVNGRRGEGVRRREGEKARDDGR
jgi:hypothetical protein